VAKRKLPLLEMPLNSNLSPTPVTLFLENGAEFSGSGLGDFSIPRSGEFVFCTAMTGMEESLTDPSFAGQVLVSTVAHVGNTGFTNEDLESEKIWAEGLVCRSVEKIPSNWRSKSSLPEWIVGEKRFIVEGIDTRQLTTCLREEGSQRGIVALRGKFSSAEACAYIKKNVPSMKGRDLTSEVSCRETYNFKSAPDMYWPLGNEFPRIQRENKKDPAQIAVWDFGVKQNTLRILEASGANVNVLSATAKADELLAAGADGIFLSNGPGDPAAATHIIAELKKVLGKRPIFAICLGHQLVAHAAGAKTYKMKFGHRGIHHPVVQMDEMGRPLRTWITSQNHGFAVDRDTLPEGVWVSFEHGDDHTVEGLSLPRYNCETVQFHPEAGPGPLDSCVLIKQFLQATLVGEHGRA
jgi:carbamoyl-phosphate synthase small subunit